MNQITMWQAGHPYRTQTEATGRSGELTRVFLDFECSQAALEKIVQSLYSQQIHVGPDDIMEILVTADYLQVCRLEWMPPACEANRSDLNDDNLTGNNGPEFQECCQ